MRWFKHYNSASESDSFQLLLAEKDYESAFVYWWILEQISKFENKNDENSRGKITLNFPYFKQKLFLNSQRTEKVLLKIRKTFKMEILINSDKTISIFEPKWLKLQENRGGKKNQKKDKNLGESREEIKESREEIKESREEIKNKKKSVETTSSHELVEIWNSFVKGSVPKVEKISSKRLQAIKAVFNDLTKEQWVETVKRIEKSDFLQGIGNNSWLINFDWFLKNYQKVREGNYDNRTNGSSIKRFGTERDDKQWVDEFNSIANGIDPATGKPLG